MAGKIAIVGCGLIGRAWAISFARGGHAVALFDPESSRAAEAIAFAKSALPDLAANDLLGGQSPEAVIGRIAEASSLEAALDGAAHVQENTFEALEVKRQVFRDLDRLAAPDTVLASSSSALLPSSFTEGLAGRRRCLVVHPINPPYLVPAVEVVPAPWTEASIVERTRKLMVELGQAPIVMKREIDGFVMNRLQGGLLQEAFRLVAEGYASAEDVDIGICQGIGLRWAFMGPFETIDLNAPGGVRDYVERYEGLYQKLWQTQNHIVPWRGATADRVEAERDKKLPRQALAERQRWRDRRLMALSAHKRRADKDFGK
ncbi:MAG TPA: 3-hydroxyacyl-CoA dehydrogenase [Dongiaceae bacterium]|jgi:L-gulonate 3-dehydrogenase|nr:3-hydroxyacyl-CoA dehydrogenase [Dongiaceae bacterium]